MDVKLCAIPLSSTWLTTSSGGLICLFFFLLIPSLSNSYDSSKSKIGYIRYDVLYRKYFNSTYFNSVIGRKDSRIANVRAEHERIIRDMNRDLQSPRTGREGGKYVDVKRVKWAIQSENARFDGTIRYLNKDKSDFSINYQNKFYQDTKAYVKKYAEENDILYILNGPSTWQRPNILFESNKIKDLTNSFILYMSEKSN